MERVDHSDFLIFDVNEMQYAVPIEYVSFIVMATEQFLACIPPKMPAYVKCIMRMEQGLVPIIDLMQVPEYGTSSGRKKQYPLVLILCYQARQIGLLTDRVAIQPAELGQGAEKGTLSRHLFLSFGEKKILQFDVAKFFAQLETMCL